MTNQNRDPQLIILKDILMAWSENKLTNEIVNVILNDFEKVCSAALTQATLEAYQKGAKAGALHILNTQIESLTKLGEETFRTSTESQKAVLSGIINDLRISKKELEEKINQLENK